MGTPRDIDRRWSLSSPLEREIAPFQVSEFEPVSEYIRKIFATYRELRVKVLTYLGNKSLERAALANRFRKGKTIAGGDRVVIRDQRQRRAGGRTVYKQPLTDPLVVESMHGNKCTLKRPDGTKVEDVHVEDTYAEG